MVAALDSRFRDQSIVQLAIYPGELQAVIVNGHNQARLVTTGPERQAEGWSGLELIGSRNAIYPEQLNPTVPGRLSSLINLRGGVALARLARFELYFRGPDAGWNIHPISGAIRFQSVLQGDSLKALTPKGVRAIN